MSKQERRLRREREATLKANEIITRAIATCKVPNEHGERVDATVLGWTVNGKDCESLTDVQAELLKKAIDNETD